MGKRTAELNRQADETWQRILGSPLSGVYVRELHQLAAEVVAEIDVAMTLVTDPPSAGVGTITVNHDVHRMLMRALSAASRIRSLCVQRGRGEQSMLEYKIHLRRADWLAGLLEGIDLEPFGDVKVRHTLEHFDEYLDRTAIAAQSGTMPMPVLIPVDVSLSSRGLLNQFQVGDRLPTTYFVRGYIGDEGLFVNCGHEVDIAALRQSGLGVRDRLSELLGSQSEGGSPVVVLTDQSFQVSGKHQ